MMQETDEGFRVTDRRRRDAIEAQTAPATAPPPRPAPPGEPPRATSEERSLVGLFTMLASEALIALGEAPDPVTGERQRELPHAAGVIDLLSLLRDKTEGRRSAQETRTLDELIYDLQLRYVEAVKSSR